MNNHPYRLNFNSLRHWLQEESTPGFYHEHFLKLFDFTPTKLNSLLQLVTKLRANKKSGKEEARLADKNIALIFEKDSARTRCFFEVVAYDQDARVTYLDSNGSQIDHRGSIKDTIHVFGRMYNGIQYRGYGQKVVETPAEYAGVSVWNGLTSEFHPTRLLADLFTTREHLPGKAFNEMTLVYAGDIRNSVGNSMLEVMTLVGLDLHLVTPQACWLETALIIECSVLAQRHGDKITLTEDIASGIRGADFIHVDVWIPMDEPKEKWTGCIALLHDYQVNSKMMVLTGNSRVKFLHCLPASHDEQATLGKKMAIESGLYGGMEVTGEVFESPASIVSDRAESRVYTIKAVTVTTLAK